MANTYNLIASNTLSSSAASVTFSAIPSTYTDLVLRVSARSDRADVTDSLLLNINGLTTSIYSNTNLFGNGATASSNRLSAQSNAYLSYIVDAASNTSNTFGNIEIYIPSYTASQNKPVSTFGAREDNSTTAVVNSVATLIQSTATISSITLALQFGPNFVSGSSFFLYGIKAN